MNIFVGSMVVRKMKEEGTKCGIVCDWWVTSRVGRIYIKIWWLDGQGINYIPNGDAVVFDSPPNPDIWTFYRPTSLTMKPINSHVK